MATVQLVDHPEHAMDFEIEVRSKLAQLGITAQQDAAGISLGQSKRECVVDRYVLQGERQFSRAGDAFARKLADFQTTVEQGLLLGRREAQQLFVEKRVWDDDFVRQSEKNRE